LQFVDAELRGIGIVAAICRKKTRNRIPETTSAAESATKHVVNSTRNLLSLMSNRSLLLEYLANRRPGEEIVFSEIRTGRTAMMEDMGLGEQFFFINV
jgi:hypothetical protein